MSGRSPDELAREVRDVLECSNQDAPMHAVASCTWCSAVEPARAALAELQAQAEAMPVIEQFLQWDALNPPPDPIPAPFADLPYFLKEFRRVAAAVPSQEKP